VSDLHSKSSPDLSAVRAAAASCNCSHCRNSPR
jgi:hypothetical protein